VPEAQEPVIVVGVLPDQPSWVLQVAGEYAREFGARLVCVTVDPTRYRFEELPNGAYLSAPIYPNLVEREHELPPEQLQEFGALLDPLGVRWSARRLIGDVVKSMVQVADEENALMFVVGARPGGLGTAVRRFFSGSIATALTHRQWRPVVVVPVEPSEPEQRLPWEAQHEAHEEQASAARAKNARAAEEQPAS
jgi:nucleotide-binding universal stress UspA family protein